MPRCAIGMIFVALAGAAGDPLDAARRLKEEGNAAAAAKAYEAALPAIRSGDDRGMLAQALLEAGQAALAVGGYPRAFERANEAAVLFRERGDRAAEATSINTAASAQLYRGEYQSALESYRRALQLDRLQKDAKGEISRLGNIGNAYFYQGKYLDALDSYEAALRRADESLGEPWGPGRRQTALTNLAVLYEQLGQFRVALDYYLKAQASSGNGITPAERGQLLSNLGTLYRRMGEAAKALESYGAARKLFAQERVSDAEIHVLQNEGVAWSLDFGDKVRGERAFEEALRLAEATDNRREIVLARLFRGESYFRGGRVADARRDFETALSGSADVGAVDEQWTALYGMARVARQQGKDAEALAHLYKAIGVIESARSSMAKPSLKSEFLADKRDVYDAAIGILLRSPRRDVPQLFQLFEQARARTLRDMLRASTSPPSLAAVQQRLPEGGALLEYWVGDGRLAALWVTRGATGVADRAWTEIDSAAVRGFVSQLLSAKDGSWKAAAAGLGNSLLANVPWTGLRQVSIVPDGVLYRLPFEVLPGAGSEQMLVERLPVSYWPSASLLFRDPPPRTQISPWRIRLAAFGDPLVDAAKALPGDEQWRRLPESARELREIARALPGRAAIYAGSSNVKRNVLAGVGGVPVVHFSTHAAVDATDPFRSRMLLTGEAGSKGSEYLFRGDVQALPIEGAELVTLSACDTEKDQFSRGEGIQSFSRALLAAGARATVTTLWRVEDGATADFMKLFYEGLGKGLSKAEALRAAKLEFLRQGGERAHPQDWAAFVLNGDGNSSLRPVYSWFLLGLVVIAVAAGALVYLRRRSGRM